MSRYDALTKYLATCQDARVPMTFSDLEKLLGFPLPASARRYRPWWANSAHGHVQSKSWLDAGYQSEQVELAAEKLVFARVNTANAPTRVGDHPLFGCLAGTITIPDSLDLTAPMFQDDEINAWADRKAALLRGEQG